MDCTFCNAAASSDVALSSCRSHQLVQHRSSRVPVSTKKHRMHSGSARSCSSWPWVLCMARVFLTAIQPGDLQVLATAGVASRRGAEDLILQGKVKVNGKVVSSNVPITREDKVWLCLVHHSSVHSQHLVDVVPVVACSGHAVHAMLHTLSCMEHVKHTALNALGLCVV